MGRHNLGTCKTVPNLPPHTPPFQPQHKLAYGCACDPINHKKKKGKKKKKMVATPQNN